MLPSLRSRRRMDLKKKLFEEFQNDCLMNFEQFRLSILPCCIPSSFRSRGCMVWKKIVFEVLKTAAMVAQHTDSAASEFTIPSLMPYKFSHCALQICRWFLEF